MLNSIFIILFSSIIFIAIVVNLALKPKISGLIIQICAFGSLLCGMLIYGYSYSFIGMQPMLAILRTVLSVCGMFVGKNELSAIAAAPYTSDISFQIIFWTAHLMAIYATASAAIATLGANIVKQFRLWLLGRRDLIIIYGVNDESFAIAKRCHRRQHASILLVDDVIPPQYNADIERYGFIVQTDNAATKPEVSFIHKYCRTNRKLTVYALHKDNFKNINYADHFQNRLSDLEIYSHSFTLILKSSLESIGDHFLLKKDNSGKITQYGFTYVYMYSDEQLIARHLMTKYPIADYITYDHEKCIASSDCDVVLVGFGTMGQSILRELVRNSQIEGSHFHISIFDRKWDQISGYVNSLYSGLLENYDIEFHNIDANSNLFYSYLTEHKKSLNYVIIASGTEKANAEIASRIMQYTQYICPNTPIFQCFSTGIKAFGNDLSSFSNWSQYENLLEIIASQDLLAKTLNHHYSNDKNRSADDTWMSCSYYNRMSSRASADFIPTILKIMGKTEEEIIETGLNLTEEQLYSLGKTEHLRWNAFMYSMGYTRMTEEEFQQRANSYLKAIERGETPSFKIGNNPKNKTHACLISWEELVDLSRKESSITGKDINYQQYDINNINLIPTLLKLK